MTLPNHAQDASMPPGKDMGIAYQVSLRIRRYFKKGVKMDEMMVHMPMAELKDDVDGSTVLRISSDMNGGIIISDDRHSEQWHISPHEIYKAYLKMRDAVVEEDK